MRSSALNSRRRASRFCWCALAAACLLSLTTGARGADDLALRRAEVAALSASEQQELLRRLERFNALPPEEQQRLRSLQAQLDADPNSQRLQQILQRYHEWLKTLTPKQRATLAELPPEKRVAEIEKMQREQLRAQRAESLSREDIPKIFAWSEQVTTKHRDAVLKQMSSEERKRFEKTDRRGQRGMVLYRSWRAIDEQDLADLSAQLSTPAQQALAKAESLSQKREIVSGWLFSAFPGGRRPNTLEGEDLVQFLETEVPPQRREELLKMPREQMVRELRRMYWTRMGGGSRFDGRREGGGSSRERGRFGEEDRPREGQRGENRDERPGS